MSHAREVTALQDAQLSREELPHPIPLVYWNQWTIDTQNVQIHIDLQRRLGFKDRRGHPVEQNAAQESAARIPMMIQRRRETIRM